MSLKLVRTIPHAYLPIVAKVYRDAMWDEYRARLYVQGVLYKPADAFTGDKEDAIGTARAMVADAAAKFPCSSKAELRALSEATAKACNDYAPLPCGWNVIDGGARKDW